MGYEIPVEEVAAACDLIPAHSYCKDGSFIKYTKLKFQRSPHWSEGKPLVQAAAKLLKNSVGQTPNQKAMVAGMVKWAKDKEFIIPGGIGGLEKACYRLRALVNQLIYVSDKTCPVEWEKHYAWLLDTLPAKER